MAKVISSLRIKLLNIVITKSLFKLSLLFTVSLAVLYLLFNIFSHKLLHHYLTKNLDAKINHEIENILASFKIENDSIVITNPAEFKESDLTEITENPFFLQVYTIDGKLLLQSENIKLFGKIEQRFPIYFESSFFEEMNSGKEELRIGYRKIIDGSGAHTAYLQLAAPMNDLNTIKKNILLYEIFTFPIVLIFITVISLFVSRKALSPINKIIKLANTIKANNLNQRLKYDADPEDEMGKLRDTLNGLLDRLETQMEQISSFSDNASHQLMTPLTAINTELDYLLKHEQKPEEYKESFILLKNQTERMIQIIRTMLMMAKDCNAYTDFKQVFNFSRLINDQIKNIYKEHRIEYSIEDDIYLRGKPDYFIIVLQNLIDNALKFSGNDWVTVNAKREKEQLILIVEDFGVGISDIEKGKIFERFYRTEQAETLGIKGYGLGLSLVNSIITAMKGTIEVENNKPKGARFIIKLPTVHLQ